jgi:hypothetical protein
MIIGASAYGRPSVIRLYKHSDGYPTGVLDGIADAIAKGKAMVDDSNKRFESHVGTKFETKLCSSTLAGLLIGEFTNEYGMGANIDSNNDNEDEPLAEYHETFSPFHLGKQSDLEWIYVIDLNNKTVNVYGGGYTEDSPQSAYTKGVVSPFIEVESYYEDAKAPHIEAISHAIKAIEATGFTFNKEAKNATKSTVTGKGSAKARPVANKGKVQSRAGRSSVGTAH